MSVSQWLTCGDPGTMLEVLGRDASARKQRLFACACCRRTAELFPDATGRAAVAVAERFADGLASAKELTDANQRVREWVDLAGRAYSNAGALVSGSGTNASAAAFSFAEAEYAAALSVAEATVAALRVPALGGSSARAAGCHAASVAHRGGARNRFVETIQQNAVRDEYAAQADLLRDLFSDQFRPVVPHPEWFTSTVMALARGIYDDGAFDRMPILADALQDAGCDSDDVLNHCRGNGPHARGCWVLDLVLGKM